MKAIRATMGVLLVALLLAGCSVSDPTIAFCPNQGRDATSVVLMAQAVPSAAYAPCITNLPAGWTFGGERIRSGRAEFWLNSDRAGFRAVTVSLTPSCDVSHAVEVPPDATEPQVKRYEEPNALPPRFFGNRYYVFAGGCVTYRFAFSRGGTFTQVVEATGALSFLSRAWGLKALAHEGVLLCGRGASCPG